MRFLSEKMFNHSSGYYIYICSNCGNNAVVNHERDIYICKTCKGDANICEIANDWCASAIAGNKIKCMNIGMKVQLTPYRMEILEQDYKGIARQLESVIEQD